MGVLPSTQPVATLPYQNINDFDTGAMMTMHDMFSSAAAFNQNIHGFNTGATITMYSMFIETDDFQPAHHNGMVSNGMVEVCEGAPVAVSGWVLTDRHDVRPCAASSLLRETMSVSNIIGGTTTGKLGISIA